MRTARNIEKRLRALERRPGAQPVVLYFADGSRRELRGPRGFLLPLFGAFWNEEKLSGKQKEQIALMRRSVRSKEPGGARLIELLLSVLNPPGEVPDENGAETSSDGEDVQ